MNFQDLVRTFKGELLSPTGDNPKVGFMNLLFGNKDQGNTNIQRSQGDIDASFREKGLIKLTDPKTGEESWSSPESAKGNYSQGWDNDTPSPGVTPPPDKSALPYYQDINKATQENELPEQVLYRMLRNESINFNPDVISGAISSPKGAQGIAQFMPDTSAWLGIDPLNPQEAIAGSGKYLADQLKTFGDIETALAAYNAGPGNVRKYGGVPPFDETEKYIADILGF